MTLDTLTARDSRRKIINNARSRLECEKWKDFTKLTVQKENTKILRRANISSVGKGYVSEFEGRVTSAVDAAKAKLKKAIEDNDTEAQVEPLKNN